VDPAKYQAAMRASMKDRTGRSFEEWLELVRPQLPAAKAGRLKWLKTTFGLAQNSAMLILDALNDGPPVTEATPFAGAGPALWAAYEALAAEIRALGPDVRTQPRQGYVAFYRDHELAAVRPGSGCLEVGLALDDPALEPAGDLGPERIRRKLRLEPGAALDHLGRAALRRAYESS
jgi:hypothetical protein